MQHQPADIEPGWDSIQDRILLEALLEQSELLIVVFDLDGRILRFNGACEALTGFTASQMIGKPIWTTLIPAAEAETVRNTAQQLASGRFPSTFVSHWLTRDGSQRLVHWRHAALPEPDGPPRRILGLGVDVSRDERLDHHDERLEAEHARGARQQGALVDALPCLVARLDRNFRVRFINRNHRDWFGLDPGAREGEHVRDLIGREAFDVLEPFFEEALLGSESSHQGIIPDARAGVRVIHGTYIPSHDEQGEIDGIYLLAVDITEQHRLRHRLSNETLRSRTVLEHALDGIIIIDEQGAIQHFNPAAERIFGYDAAAVLGRNVTVLMPEPHHSQHDEYIRHYLANGEGRIIGKARELTGRHQDGSPIELSLAVAQFTENGKVFLVGFTSDITQRKTAERQSQAHLRELAHLNRRAGLHALTAGLAHELSQPLTAIRATTEACIALVEKGQVSPESLRAALQQVSQQAARAGQIIHSVRSFLRKDDKPDTESHDTNTMINTVLDLLSHEIETAGVKVVRNLHDPVCHCMANRIQIEQVLFNLIRNAVEAMTETATERVLDIESCFDAESRTCSITIADSGPGIAAEHFERLFEPFFTTRPTGLGQGLSICRSIVEQYGGTLTATNGPERGARFTLTLSALHDCNGDDSKQC